MKGDLEFHPVPLSPPRPRRSISSVIAVILAIALIAQNFPSILNSGAFGRRFWPSETQTEPTNESKSTAFQWSSIESSEKLEFHSCYGGLECAKLSLPLDYWNGTHPDKTISLAVAKIPAKVPVTDPRYGGPILINPGGPGGSGVMIAVGLGKTLQNIVDPLGKPETLDSFIQNEDDAKFFDIIGFDPRGVGQTEPKAVCLPDLSSYWVWLLRQAEEGLFTSSNAAAGRLYQMSRAFGTSCKEYGDGVDDIKYYLSTASVARDMLELAEKHAEYVADQKNKMLHHQQCKTCRTTGVCAKVQQAPYKYTRGETKLQYWGFSYGSYLGYNFAALFPDRVERLVIDGVVWSETYLNHLGGQCLRDTEKVMQTFYTWCSGAGPQACPLASYASSPKDIEARVQGIVNGLLHKPLPVPSEYGPEVITYTDVKSLIFGVLYSPLVAYRGLSKILDLIEKRDGASFGQALRYGHQYNCARDSDNSTKAQPGVPQKAILCGDVNSMDLSYEGFSEYWHELDEKSPSGGALWATIKLGCNNWGFKGLYRFTGPFEGETSHPLLLIGNTADPVTPLWSAKKMSEGFKDSVVLTQDSAGHCSISTPTFCTMMYVRQYFQTGDLPPKGMVCVPGATAFSLNSTDPTSLFYDSELEAISTMYQPDLDLDHERLKYGSAWTHEHETQFSRLKEDIESLMDAGHQAKDWFAQQNMWGFGDEQTAEHKRTARLFGNFLENPGL